ncbi:hypothetical protein V7S43_001774 [Phytophthora oleae]|uniref:Uncharacterized protein n=1 Tax=Phytophthora oleae TaxID=2107226 RepID=A0ABD3G3H9_9STRA
MQLAHLPQHAAAAFGPDAVAAQECKDSRLSLLADRKDAVFEVYCLFTELESAVEKQLHVRNNKTAV